MSTQKGGFYPGMILGFLLGVATALGVALYVTKAPVPFIDKVPQRRTSSEAAEAERNRNWDPNAPLQGRGTSRPAAVAPAPAPQAEPSWQPNAPAAAAPVQSAAPQTSSQQARAATGSTRDPAAILGERPAAEAGGSYFVQTGAFARVEDAEQQRARLAMIGLTARITEREQTGRTVYRVRLGPFDAREDAESTRERVAGSGMDAALVRVQR
ncbi:SPOR domain-containing protein [Caldimonas tepidiphila]|uniref:SPOR domain-containing protein n=1 Tax=Caldimonas tepidiphila TaxID=2315841 RepID=UPI000E5BCD4C|nr:SPOR domain-containing protein [Caldimonas tepidiphila]